MQGLAWNSEYVREPAYSLDPQRARAIDSIVSGECSEVGMSSGSRSLVQILFFAAKTDCTTWHSRTCEVEFRSVNELLSMTSDSAFTKQRDSHGHLQQIT
jgi:hypothetical protein